MSTRAHRARIRLLVTGEAAVLAAALAVVTSSGPAPVHAPRADAAGEVGSVTAAQWLAEEARLVADPAPDPAGQQGSGGRLVGYHPGGKVLRRGGDARLFHTRHTTLEPSMGIAPDGSIYIDVAAHQTVGPVDNFTTSVLRSGDRGAHWVTAGAGSQHDYTSDPYLYVDPRTGRVFHNDLALRCQETSYSDDGGRTWTNSVANCDQEDHQNLFAGPAPQGQAAPQGYKDIVYDCAINAGLAVYSKATSCDKSMDGGATFTLTGSLAYPPTLKGVDNGLGCDGATGDGWVGRDGTVYLPRGWCGQPWLAISHDEGASWTRVQVAHNGMNAGTDPMTGNHLPLNDHEAAVVTDRFGTLYYLWVAHDYKPYLAISRDHGRSWTAPMMVAPPGVHETALPALAVSPAQRPGHLAIAFMGSTDAPTDPYPHTDARFANATWNGYVVETTTALRRSPILYGGPVNDPMDPFVVGNCAPVRCQAEYDFIDVEVAPDGRPWTVFVDGCYGPQTCTTPGEAVVGTVLGGLRL